MFMFTIICTPLTKFSLNMRLTKELYHAKTIDKTVFENKSRVFGLGKEHLGNVKDQAFSEMSKHYEI